MNQYPYVVYRNETINRRWPRDYRPGDDLTAVDCGVLEVDDPEFVGECLRIEHGMSIERGDVVVCIVGSVDMPFAATEYSWRLTPSADVRRSWVWEEEEGRALEDQCDDADDPNDYEPDLCDDDYHQEPSDLRAVKRDPEPLTETCSVCGEPAPEKIPSGTGDPPLCYGCMFGD